jgi:hypothetical protein
MVLADVLIKFPKITGLCDITETLVGEDNATAFAEWAFGEGFSQLIGMDKFADAWNERHSDLFLIEKNSPIVYDMIKMTELWKEYESSL